ncbi:hypothetical protein M404DRAFT_18196 [Pisolithus tinctorius Marx 270]|uniref:Uncharacterized protein n=1 Tax=Pisolithus tinctorius Marx 270 TaxID=870435 RepID=A0A0C3KWP9_PISTI|nr:hypothetical protein M404DRAFT_18196 [Pisolithus tinctorius Marx 270]
MFARPLRVPANPSPSPNHCHCHPTIDSGTLVLPTLWTPVFTGLLVSPQALSGLLCQPCISGFKAFPALKKLPETGLNTC